MGKVGHEDYSDIKSKLVAEICNISSVSNNHYNNNGCVHIHNIRQRHQNPSKPSSHFIDWYRLLGVEENAGIDVIRRKYHKLALQLHPDKNKHPKADIAFKLVSEAHSCLSDNAKRRAFDLERWKNFCFQCNAVSMPSSSSSSNAPKQKLWSAPSKSKSHRFLKSLKDIRDKFREETRVIEKCLKTKPVNVSPSPKEEESSSASAPHLVSRPDRLFRSVSHKESPVFNPTDYAFDGYPHVRSRVQKKPENFWYLQAGNLLNYERGQGKCDSPIFEIRSDRRAVFKSKSTCVRS